MEEAKRYQQLFKDVFSAQQFLISSKNLKKDQWDLCAMYLRPSDLAEVLEERSCNNICGNVMCNNTIQSVEDYQRNKLAKITRDEGESTRSVFDPPIAPPKQLLQYNRKKKEFVDVKDELGFCCKKCFVDSQVLSRTLDTTPVNLRNLPHGTFNDNVARLMETIVSDNDKMDIDNVKVDTNLNLVREELAAVNASTVSISVSENQNITAPSTHFEDVDTKKKEEIKKKKQKEIPFSMQLSNFAVLYEFLEDSVTKKTISFLKLLQEELQIQKIESDSSKYWFPPISSGYKRYEILQAAISDQYLTIQRVFGFDRNTLTFIGKVLKTFRYYSALKITSQRKMVLTWVLIFVASEYLPETKKKIEEQLQVIKRILRVECEMRRGQFEELVKVFDTNQKERLF